MFETQSTSMLNYASSVIGSTSDLERSVSQSVPGEGKKIYIAVYDSLMTKPYTYSSVEGTKLAKC